MSREIEIEGRIVKVMTVSDIAPNGIEELAELCKSADPAVKPCWASPPVINAPTDDEKA